MLVFDKAGSFEVRLLATIISYQGVHSKERWPTARLRGLPFLQARSYWEKVEKQATIDTVAFGFCRKAGTL